MGYEQRVKDGLRENQLATTRRVELLRHTIAAAEATPREHVIFSIEGTKVQCDGKALLWEDGDGVSHIYLLLAGDHIATYPLNSPQVVPIHGAIEVVPS